MSFHSPFSVFQEEAPEIAAAFDGLVRSLIQSRGLDPKTKQLIYIGIKVAQGDILAVEFHVPMAKKLGATRDEIKDTILLTLTTNGLKGVTACLPRALEIYDRVE
ncbi:MAG: carboxymuconolactone decarboxylase [Gammaproteobacteria bacterium RIFCSPHIGHO2_02_FULL_42_13]|nr:MAG: carboxymuconolactone decarboxylase [Gammaproteobacteria bacterium RIFCSPHIGHO2_02_FULL_42_13]OGT68089.1 MAG: carboxymuconolactone decarboxylase [Gammaproteobacteria bacterium RIFCSPLOWO2_02_FULL_42_9]